MTTSIMDMTEKELDTYGDTIEKSINEHNTCKQWEYLNKDYILDILNDWLRYQQWSNIMEIYNNLYSPIEQLYIHSTLMEDYILQRIAEHIDYGIE